MREMSRGLDLGSAIIDMAASKVVGSGSVHNCSLLYQTQDRSGFKKIRLILFHFETQKLSAVLFRSGTPQKHLLPIKNLLDGSLLIDFF